MVRKIIVVLILLIVFPLVLWVDFFIALYAGAWISNTYESPPSANVYPGGGILIGVLTFIVLCISQGIAYDYIRHHEQD